MRLGNSWEDSCSPASSSDITRQRGSKTEYSECRTRTIKIRQEARRRRRWRHTSLTLRTGEKLAQGHYCVERRRGSMKHADTRNTGKTQRQTLAARNVSALSGRNEGENLHFISFFLLLCVSMVCSFWCLGYLSILVRVGGEPIPALSGWEADTLDRLPVCPRAMVWLDCVCDKYNFNGNLIWGVAALLWAPLK